MSRWASLRPRKRLGIDQISTSAQEGIILTEAQVAALEKAKAEKETHGEFESEHRGYCGAQDTVYVGNIKSRFQRVVCAERGDSS